MIERCAALDAGWLALREALWPDGTREEHLEEMAAWCAHPDRAAFLARDGRGEAVGFLEAALRHDYVNGTSTTPVGFVEGLYVAPAARRAGVARALVAEAQRWAAGLGCREMASDVVLGNEASEAAHRALGFEETDRVIYFRKELR